METDAAERHRRWQGIAIAQLHFENGFRNVGRPVVRRVISVTVQGINGSRPKRNRRCAQVGDTNANGRIHAGRQFDFEDLRDGGGIEKDIAREIGVAIPGVNFTPRKIILPGIECHRRDRRKVGERHFHNRGGSPGAENVTVVVGRIWVGIINDDGSGARARVRDGTGGAGGIGSSSQRISVNNSVGFWQIGISRHRINGGF